MRWCCVLFLIASVVPAAEKTETKADSEKAAPERRTRVRLAGIAVSGGYSRYSGYSPWFYGYPWGYGYGYPWAYGYGPWFSPALLFHSGYWNGYRQAPNMGEVQLKTGQRDAQVYIDGAYAGEAKDRRSMWLEPGVYNVEVRSGNEKYEKRIYVLSGKTLRLNAEFAEARP